MGVGFERQRGSAARAFVRGFLRRAGAGFLGLCIALVLAELALRTVGAYEPSPPMYPGEIAAVENDDVDPWVGWKMPPEHGFECVSSRGEFAVRYRSNARGFRGPLDLAEGKYRVVFLGDSFTFGHGVEEARTFVGRLRSSWSEASCFNFGMSGFGIDQMSLTLAHYAADLTPRLVVLVFVEDDLNRSMTAYRKRGKWMRKPLFALRGEEVVPLSPGDAPAGILNAALRAFRLGEAARRLANAVGRSYPVGSRWKLNRALFEQVRDQCTDLGAELVVVHASRRSLPVLAPEFRRLEIAFLDLSPSLRSRADELYFRTDPHWNENGHRFVAEAIREFLTVRGTGPESAATDR